MQLLDHNAYHKTVQEQTGKERLASRDIEEHADTIQRCWQEMGGTGDTPYLRSAGYNGHTDDAILVTSAHYKRHLKDFEGSEQSDHHLDLEYDAVSPAFIQSKWLVIVDYHY